MHFVTRVSGCTSPLILFSSDKMVLELSLFQCLSNLSVRQVFDFLLLCVDDSLAFFVALSVADAGWLGTRSTKFARANSFPKMTGSIIGVSTPGSQRTTYCTVLLVLVYLITSNRTSSVSPRTGLTVSHEHALNEHCNHHLLHCGVRILWKHTHTHNWRKSMLLGVVCWAYVCVVEKGYFVGYWPPFFIDKKFWPFCEEFSILYSATWLILFLLPAKIKRERETFSIRVCKSSTALYVPWFCRVTEALKSRKKNNISDRYKRVFNQPKNDICNTKDSNIRWARFERIVAFTYW